MVCCHDHGSESSDESLKKRFRNIAIAAAGNGFLSLIEYVAFLWTKSVPMNAAYLHDAADFGECLIFLLLLKGIQKTPYLERVAGIGSGLLMMYASGSAFMSALEHMRNPQAIKTDVLAFLAIFNFCINAFMAIMLNKGKTDFEKISSLHFLQDAAGSAAILLTWAVSFMVNPRDGSLFDAFIAFEVTGAILFMTVLRTGKLLFGGPKSAHTPSHT